MWTAETVLLCALTLLTRAPDSFPPIHFVHEHPADVSAHAEALVRSGERPIHLLTSSRLFRRAQAPRDRSGDLQALRKLGSMLVHEEWHRKSLSLRYSCVAGMAATGPPASDGSHMSSLTPDRGASKIVDLEVKDARVIFTAAWQGLEEEVGREHLRFPKEIILLGGAPGAGKGTHTQFINQARGLTCPPIVISELLTTPEMEKLKAHGAMVGDKEVVSVLLRKLLEPTYRDGVVLDGFPRTPVQVECLKLLVDKIGELHDQFATTPLAVHFRRPTIHAMVLFVSESTSVERQQGRGREIAEHNRKVGETGVGAPIELRATDMSEALARRRYQVFKEQTWDALTSLRQLYHYHFVNAEGPIAEVQANILKELKYQSSLELDPRTFERLRALPLAEELVVHGRQELVKRLDSYELEHTWLLAQVVEIVSTKFMPIITRHALSGRAHVNSEDPIFLEPLAIPMLIDLFSERGYHAVVDKHIQEVPERVDLATGEIKCRTKAVFRIQIHFEASKIRRG